MKPADLAQAEKEDWVDHARRPCVIGSTAYVPVREGFSCDRQIAERVQYRGRGFFMLGDIAVIRGEVPTPDEIRAITALRNPRAIIRIRSISDPTRTPDCEVLYGEAGEVSHHENGYTYLLDPRNVMFAQGNLNEKRRMVHLVQQAKKRERVADMFAGIGYFTIPMAGAGAAVHAIEINPVAFKYLERNVELNGLSGAVRASLGDCRDILSGFYDRIVMGHFDAVTMLPHALSHVGAGSIIHLHSIGPVAEKIRPLLAGAGFSGDIHVHKVKKYRPRTWHIVQDIVIE
jgi:tRNA wybutosine-synthesizing protein 2